MMVLFIRQDITSKLVSIENSLTEAFFVEINLKKRNGYSVVLTIQIEKTENYVETLSKSLDLYSSSHENLVMAIDFNACVEEFCMSSLCDTFGLKSLVRPSLLQKPRKLR